MKVEKISELTTNRLSVYLRCLTVLDLEGSKTVSSDLLAKRFHLNSAQIRKDLAYFGEFGVRGVGYYVQDLRNHLTKILGLDKELRVAIIGAGRLGTALADYYGFRGASFTVVGLFDVDQNKIGQKIGNTQVFDIKNFALIAKRAKIDLAVIAAPTAFAQSLLDQVADAGIKAVLNFAPTPLRVPSEVKLKTVDLTTCLESLSYFLAKESFFNGENVETKMKKAA